MPISTLRLLALFLVFKLPTIHATILPPNSFAKAEVQDPIVDFTLPDCSNQNWSSLNHASFWNETYWWNPTMETHNLCEEITNLQITVSNACSGNNVRIEYLLFLDLDQNGTQETVVNSADTTLGWNKVLYNNANTPNFTGGLPQAFDERAVPEAEKYGFALQAITNDTQKIASVRWNTQLQRNNYVLPELPHGTHKIKWLITDNCGTNLEYEYTFTVKDCQAPTVVCLQPLSINVLSAGFTQLWASDFLLYREDNCMPPDGIEIAIRKCGTGTGFPRDTSEKAITNLRFSCSELGAQCVELWAIDAAGNTSFCEASLMVLNNLGNCGGPSSKASGYIKNETQEGVEAVIVRLTGTFPFVPPFGFDALTGANGLYILIGHPLGAHINITPEKDDNPSNGVTTYDLVLISKHILGLEPFSSPYKMIAADVNKSGSVTTFDMVEIRKLILGVTTEFPNNNAWRFVEKAFVFPNASNPFQTAFPESIAIANADGSEIGLDFVGVKIGDVNNTAIPNATGQSEVRSVGTAFFDVSPSPLGERVAPGETFEVQFKSAQVLEGFQFTITLDGLKALETVDDERVNSSNFNLLPDNAMTVSIDGAQEFTLRFRAEQGGKLSEMLGVSGAITRAEAYGDAGRLGVAFRFDGKTIAGVGFELYQNQPNPFVNKTNIGFYLPEAAEATLSVFDESGRVVYQQKGQFAKGENSIQLDRALINTTGLLYYKLETATDSETKKMIQAK